MAEFLQLEDGSYLSTDIIWAMVENSDAREVTMSTAHSTRTYSGADAEAIRAYVLAHRVTPPPAKRHS